MARSPILPTTLDARLTVVEELLTIALADDSIRLPLVEALKKKARLVAAERHHADTPQRKALDTAWTDTFVRLGIRAV